jgi:hypothetical protein
MGNGIGDDAKLAWHHLFLQNFKHRQRSNHFGVQGLLQLFDCCSLKAKDLQE